jgi:DegV family protein with EDD domain
MKVITDTAANLGPEKAKDLGVEVIPFCVTFMGKSYRDDTEISSEELYQLFSNNPTEFPTTSQPSVGDFVAYFQKYQGEEILSVQVSSGLSGTWAAAMTASQLVPDSKIAVVDSKVLGPAQGWMVEVAAQGAKLGWSMERTLKAVQRLRDNSLTLFTIGDLKYLIHGGRIDHLHSLIGSLLKIKPVIGMNEEDGRYKTFSQELTMSRAVRRITDIITNRFGAQKLRVQLAHGNNPDGIDLLRTAVSGMLVGIEEAVLSITPVLGAHTGPTLMGMAAMPVAIYEELMGG